MVTTAQAYFCSLWYGKVNEYVIPSELVKDSNIGNFFPFWNTKKSATTLREYKAQLSFGWFVKEPKKQY